MFDLLKLDKDKAKKQQKSPPNKMLITCDSIQKLDDIAIKKAQQNLKNKTPVIISQKLPSPPADEPKK
jgi:predicted house-cleaning NTP pyrophosphatase (Maf/HAM1 superfamily)